MASYPYSNQRHSNRRAPLQAKAVPMPRPHERVVEIARIWLAPMLIVGWLCRLAFQFAL